MVKYLLNAHGKLVTLVLVDLILLVLLGIIVSLSYTSYYSIISNFPSFILNPLFYLLKSQMLLFAAITTYLFTGSRFQNMMRFASKEKTIHLQSFAFIAVLIIGFISSALQFNWRLTTQTNIMLGVILPWYLLITILFGYQMLYFSNLKFQSNIFKVGICLFGLYVASIFATGAQFALQNIYMANQYLIMEFAADINPIHLTHFIIYNQPLLITTLIAIIILTVGTIGLIEIKKVGS